MSRAERRRQAKGTKETKEVKETQASPLDTTSAAVQKGAGEGPSPLAPWIERVSLALVVATLVLRIFTSGGGIELLQPGVQVLADSLALCAAGCLVASRVLGHEPVFRCAGWAPWVLLAWVAWLSWGAADASHADLAWRSVLTFAVLPLLGLVALELCAGNPARSALLLATLLAAVALGALLAAYQGLVEIPALIHDYQTQDPELMAEIALQDPSYRMALIERLHSRGATGPFLLPGLLASACAAVIPLLGLIAGRRLAAKAHPRALVGAAVLVVVALGLVVSRSKGALVSGAVVICAALLLAPGLRRHRRKLLVACAIGVAALTCVGLIAVALGPERAGVGLSLTVRLEYWEAAWGMWQDAPLRGLGINHFREYYSSYKSIRAEEALHAHSAPLQLLAETGVVGLALFGATLAAFVRPGLAVAWGPKEEVEPCALPLADVAFLSLGVFTGWLLLGAHGDTYNAGTTEAWLSIGLGLGVLAPALAWALWRLSPRLVAGAALAGAVVFLGDGLLNFGVHHAGLALIVWLLLGLAPTFRAEPLERATPGGAAVGAVICLVALGVIGIVLPGSLEAEGSRALARARHQDAAAGLKVEANLRQAEAEFALACAAAPLNARTWLERGAVQARLGDALKDPSERQALWEAGVESTREAIRLAPRNAGATFQLGRLFARPGAGDLDLAEAQAAFDRTLEIYPGHPEHLLEAASVRVRRARLGERGTLREEARTLLSRAEEVSRATRLKRIQLRPSQVQQIARLRRELAALEGPPSPRD